MERQSQLEMARVQGFSHGEYGQVVGGGPGRQPRDDHVSGSRKRHQIQRRRNAPTDRSFQYWVEGKRSVEPLHDRLQARFVEYLKTQRIIYRENDDYIDVQYSAGGRKVFCEIKPTEKVATRYAIRAAIGQLLEYQFKHKSDALLEMVLGSKPRPNEIAFVRSLGFSLKYYDAGQKTFESV
jgi:hypothetical protein